MGAFALGASQNRVKIRVLEVLASLRRGGAERVAVSLARGLDRDVFQIEVAALFDASPGDFEPLLHAAAIPVHRLGKRRGFDARIFGRLAGVMRAFRPHVVHTHSYILRYAWPARSLSGGGSIVHTVHNLAPREGGRLGVWIHRLAMRAGVCSVAVSDEVARSYAQTYGRPVERIIPNGIDLAPFVQPPQGVWRREHGFRDEERLVVSVARLDPQKNPLKLIDAFAAALGNNTEWHLVMAGDGSLREEAMRRAASLHLKSRVHFPGVVERVETLLADADVFALASDWEGLPVALIEGMACGLPVVATAVGGVPELVEHQVTGMIVPPGNGGALAQAFTELAQNPALRRQLGAAARAKAMEFGLERMLVPYARLFESIARGAQ